MTNESASQLPCIRCDKELEPASDKGVRTAIQPYAGTSFSTSGHYGSTAFDPMDSSRIHINICDDCLKEKASEGKVILSHPIKVHRVEYEYVNWQPSHQEDQ